MEEIFEPLGFNPYDLIKDYNALFLRDEINPYKFKETDRSFKKLYNERFAPKLEELGNSCSFKSKQELIEIQRQYGFIKDFILVKYHDVDGNIPDPTYDGFKQLSFDGLVFTFLEDAIKLISDFIINPTIILIGLLGYSCACKLQAINVPTTKMRSFLIPVIIHPQNINKNSFLIACTLLFSA